MVMNTTWKLTRIAEAFIMNANGGKYKQLLTEKLKLKTKN